MQRKLTLALLLGIVLVSGLLIYTARYGSANRAIAEIPLTSTEQPVTLIPLSGPLAARNSEVSGLAWYQEHLIILPQYPDRLGSNRGYLFALPQADIEAFLDGQTSSPLEPVPIAFEAPDYSGQIEGFQGYEAIAFSENQAFITIEAEPDNAMMGYLITGTLAEDLSQLQIDPAKRVQIPPQSSSPNKAEEALLVANDQVLSFYEANGVQVNPTPIAHTFNLDLTPSGNLPLPNLEYRLTDVTALDEVNRFWAINYFFRGDRDLRPERDPLAIRYGIGTTHRQQDTVERLVEFAYSETGITFTETPPIQLALGSKGRNWEGIVRLDDRGFLLMTDKFPNTFLGFVALPANNEQ